VSELGENPMERLRSLDPANGATYRHGNQGAMLSRITATPRVAKVRVARGLRLRMGGAVAAASLVTVAGIAALSGAAPSLSVLAIGTHAPQSQSLGATATTTPNADMLPFRAANIQFVAGPDLTSGVSSAPSYDLSPVGDFASTSQQIANTLNVSGAVTGTPGPNGSWTIGDTSSSYVEFSSDTAELNWSFTNVLLADANEPLPPLEPGSSSAAGSSIAPVTITTGPAPATTPGIGDATALSSLQSELANLNVSGPFGTPSYSDDVASDGTTWTTVTLPWSIGGPGSDFSFDATYDGSGTLVYADGTNVAVSVGASYPLLSEVAGVAALQSQQGSDGVGDVNPGGPIISNSPPTTTPAGSDGSGSVSTTDATSSGSTTGTAGASSGDTTTTSPGTTPTTVPITSPSTVPTTVPVQIETLDSVTIQYAEYTLSGDTEVLLPQYVYADQNGEQWTVLAVDPAYVQLDPNQGGTVSPLLF
jgi:hypothetical protein